MERSDTRIEKFSGLADDYKARLWAVIVLNALMFVLEMSSGIWANSHALQADAADFFADAVTCSATLLVIGSSLRSRATVALLKGVVLVGMGCWILLSGLRADPDELPVAAVMGAVGGLAILANLTSVTLLAKYRNGDANVRSAWLCSRNDAIGNFAVLAAAAAVATLNNSWPDRIVALLMAGLFLSSGIQILAQACSEINRDRD